MLGAGILIAAFGVLAFLVRDNERDSLGAVGMFGFGVALVIAAMLRRSPVPPSPIRRERVERDGRCELATVVVGSHAALRRKWPTLIGFVILGAVLAFAPGVGPSGRVAGVLCIVLFGTVTLISLRTFRNPWRLTLFPEGLQWEIGAAPGFVRWDDIAHVGLFAVSGAPFLGLDVHDRDAIRATTAQRRIGSVNRVISGADVSITIDPFRIDHDALAETIFVYSDDPSARKEIGTDATERRLRGDAADALQPRALGGARASPYP